MNKPRAALLSVLLTVSLAVNAPPAQAVSLNPGSISGFADLLSFIQQVQSWITSLKAMIKMKDDLFGSVNFDDFGASLAKKLGGTGLPIGEIMNTIGDIRGLLGEYDRFKAQIQAFRDQLNGAAQATIDGFVGGLNTYEKTIKMEGTLGLDPSGSQTRAVAVSTILAASGDTGDLVQNDADSTKAIDDIKKTTQETSDRANVTALNSQKLTLAAEGIQSTREGVQLLVRAQAETLMSSAYNATATTTALSQVAMQTQVSNKLLGDMVQDVIDQRVGAAYAQIQVVKARQLEAQMASEQIKSVVGSAASGMETAFMVSDDVDADVMFP